MPSLVLRKKGAPMGAKRDLNEAYVTGSLLIAAVLGAMSQSFPVFVVSLVLLVVIQIGTRKNR